MGWCIVAAGTRTRRPAVLVIREALTVKFEALRLPAVARFVVCLRRLLVLL